MKKEVPILFSADMIKALLAGRKTKTRRTINPQPIKDFESGYVYDGKHKTAYKDDATHRDWRTGFISDHATKWEVGNILWVRENFYFGGEYTTFSIGDTGDSETRWVSNGIIAYMATDEKPEPSRGMPCIHMLKIHARIWLEILSVNIERLSELEEVDAMDEGIMVLPDSWVLEHFPEYAEEYKKTIPGERPPLGISPRERYMKLWALLNGKESLDANPWVYVIEFKILSTTGKPLDL